MGSLRLSPATLALLVAMVLLFSCLCSVVCFAALPLPPRARGDRPADAGDGGLARSSATPSSSSSGGASSSRRWTASSARRDATRASPRCRRACGEVGLAAAAAAEEEEEAAASTWRRATAGWRDAAAAGVRGGGERGGGGGAATTARRRSAACAWNRSAATTRCGCCRASTSSTRRASTSGSRRSGTRCARRCAARCASEDGASLAGGRRRLRGRDEGSPADNARSRWWRGCSRRRRRRVGGGGGGRRRPKHGRAAAPSRGRGPIGEGEGASERVCTQDAGEARDVQFGKGKQAASRVALSMRRGRRRQPLLRAPRQPRDSGKMARRRIGARNFTACWRATLHPSRRSAGCGRRTACGPRANSRARLPSRSSSRARAAHNRCRRRHDFTFSKAARAHRTASAPAPSRSIMMVFALSGGLDPATTVALLGAIDARAPGERRAARRWSLGRARHDAARRR